MDAGRNYGIWQVYLTGERRQDVEHQFQRFFVACRCGNVYLQQGSRNDNRPITAAENNAGKRWGSSIYKGDELTIEVKVPTSEKANLSLRITNVAYGYKDMFVDKIAGFGQSGACNINVLCPQGAAWAAERNSVAWITSSDGGRLCSSAMLMNTCSTNIPYVLTANHCFQANQDVGGWRFQFQAWSATCDGILF